MDKTKHQEHSPLLILPDELLLYIMSFLRATRDLVKMRYVSRRLRAISETSSLWSKFTWPLYNHREELSVINVLKVCGQYVKRLIFPDHVTPLVLCEMVSYCKNITLLSIPTGTELDARELSKSVQCMQDIEKLEVQFSGADITPLLSIRDLYELTIYVPRGSSSQCESWVKQWKRKKFLPQRLTFVADGMPGGTQESLLELLVDMFVYYKQHKGYVSCFKLYDDYHAPLNLFSNLPEFQMSYGKLASTPFAQCSDYGIFGLEDDFLALTDNGVSLVKAQITRLREVSCDYTNTFTDGLKFVTEFSFGCDDSISVFSGHLEQLAVACPNLQRLDLEFHCESLISLQGLQAIAQSCKELCGLNLMHISLENIESHLKLWKILSSMKLTHLSMEVCAFIGNSKSKQQLTRLFKKCTSLQALQLDTFCHEECERANVNWSLLSNFPALRYCRLSTNDSNVIQGITLACKELVCLGYESSIVRRPLSLSSISHHKLQQLYIDSPNTVVPDNFMETISAHGQLERVIIAVSSLTTKGITSLISNSPGLLTLIIITENCVYNGKHARVASKDIMNDLEKKFPKRKLISVGNCKLLQKMGSDRKWFAEEFMCGTDLQPLWL